LKIARVTISALIRKTSDQVEERLTLGRLLLMSQEDIQLGRFGRAARVDIGQMHDGELLTILYELPHIPVRTCVDLSIWHALASSSNEAQLQPIVPR
jgi:hypothetical protein